MSTIGLKELAVLVIIVLFVLELRRARRFARGVQSRVVAGTVSTAARM